MAMRKMKTAIPAISAGWCACYHFLLLLLILPPLVDTICLRVMCHLLPKSRRLVLGVRKLGQSNRRLRDGGVA